MKYNKIADTLLFLLSKLLPVNMKKILKKHYLRVQALKKGEKQRLWEWEYFTAIFIGS